MCCCQKLPSWIKWTSNSGNCLPRTASTTFWKRSRMSGCWQQDTIRPRKAAASMKIIFSPGWSTATFLSQKQMPGKHLFEYAVIRVVPRVEREEFLNVGVILYCRDKKFLQCRYVLNKERLHALCGSLD